MMIAAPLCCRKYALSGSYSRYSNSHRNPSCSIQSGGQRLFDSLFVYENYPEADTSDNLNISFDESVEKLDYPLSVLAYETKGKLLFKLQYAAEIFHHRHS